MIYEVSASDLVIFDDDFDCNIRPQTLEDVITFSDNVFSNFQYLQINDILVLSDHSISGGTRQVSATDVLEFTDETWPRVLFVNIDDFLFLWDVVEEPLGGVIQDTLVLSESLLISATRALQTDTLTFTDELGLQIIGVRGPNDVLQLSDYLSVVLINDLTPYRPLDYVEPTINLVVSLADTTETLEILNPDFGDSDNIGYKRINRTTRGYTPIIRGIAGWTPKKIKKMSFSYLKESETYRLKVFWRRNCGKPVTLTDMYGTSYTVILQNPEYEIAQVGRENRSLTLDFYVL